MHGTEGLTTLPLRLRRDTAPTADATGPETPEDAARFSAKAAPQSLKSRLEGAGGGDPDLRTVDAPRSGFGRGALRDPGPSTAKAERAGGRPRGSAGQVGGDTVVQPARRARRPGEASCRDFGLSL